MVTNNNKPVDNKQMWQQMEPSVTASSALSALTTVEDGSDRFIYYIVGTLFYRYDTYGNTWNKLAAPFLTPTVFASLRYTKYGGNRGRVISTPSSTTLRIAGLNAGIFKDKTIRITHGTGAGQVRTISDSPEPVKYEQGLATTASTSTLGDNTKKWKFNQWSGYQCRITANTGQTQIRKILYNDTTTLTFSDTNYQPIDPWNNSLFTTAPVITAGLQAHFVIEATDITVSAWTINPDYTSRFVIESGGIWLLTSATAAPFYSLQYYDVASDYWQNKTASTGLVLAAFGTDGTQERTGEIGGIYSTGTATSGTTYTLTDTTKAWTVDAYKNYRVRITGGTGAGQERRIVCNGATVLEVNRKWDTNPDVTSTYEIIADKNKIYFGGNAQSMLYQYDTDSDLPMQGSKADDGIANNLAARSTGIEQQPIAITTGIGNTGGITGVNATPTAGGSGYIVGDILTVTTGGTNGKVIVEATSPTGIVTSISLLRPGLTYTTGTGKVTSGGTGTGCTIEITTVGVVCYVTTAIIHNFKIGDVVTLSGDALYAGNVTIIGCDTLTTFDFATAAAGNMTAANSNSATLIVDTTKNWTTNEHVGKIIQTHLVGVSGTVQPRVVTANTATTITIATITTALVNGTGRYVIIEGSALGRDEQYKNPTKNNTGHASSGTATTLTDSAKNWNTNQWAGYKIRVLAGTGRDYYWTITSNTATTLTYTAPGFTPDTTTHYIIFDTFGACTGAGSTTTFVDTTKNWAVNQWAGKRIRIIAGAGFGLTAALNEMTILSNTATVLTISTAVTGLAPDATTVYTILGIPIRGAGIELVWAFGGNSAGRYMYFPRGSASNIFDRYDIVKEIYEYGYLLSPQTDTLTTGTYYAYDGVDRIYFSPGVATGIVQYIYYYDLTLNKILGFGSVPNTQLAPVLGNRMEIVTSPQGIDYIYHMRNTGSEMYRAMIYF